MLHSYAIRCGLITLLISTTFVQSKTTINDFPYTHEWVSVTPKTDWHNATYNNTEACPGIRAGVQDEQHQISLHFRGVGIDVYGYAADPWTQSTWKFQVDNESTETIPLETNTGCILSIKNRPLTNRKHRVVLTPGSNFVLTKFSVTEEHKDPLRDADIIGIAIGCASLLLAVPGAYFGYKQWSRIKNKKYWFSR